MCVPALSLPLRMCVCALRLLICVGGIHFNQSSVYGQLVFLFAPEGSDELALIAPKSRIACLPALPTGLVFCPPAGSPAQALDLPPAYPLVRLPD